MDFKQKDRYEFSDLVTIVKLLRGENGCPWDKEQTHESIRQNFIEETYEAIEAIDTKDTELLKEELGDVMLQVVFHAIMEEEEGRFDINDVADGICKKLIVRHPHVFSDVIANDTAQVLKNWDQIKMQTKSQKTQTQAIKSVSKALPSLMRSQKIQQKAAKVGFDFSDVSGAVSKLDEEVEELKEAIRQNDINAQNEELGDVLFSLVNVSRFLKVDPEKALYDSCDKFTDRFEKVEEAANQQGLDMKNTDLNTLDSLWERAKEINN